MAGYLFSNTKLREELTNAKDADAAAKVLSKHLQHDGKQIGREVQKFVHSKEVQENFKKAKKYAKEYAGKLKKDMKGYVAEGQKQLKGSWSSKKVGK